MRRNLAGLLLSIGGLFFLASCGGSDRSATDPLLSLSRSNTSFNSTDETLDSNTKIKLYNADFKTPRRVEKQTTRSGLTSKTPADDASLKQIAQSAMETVYPAANFRLLAVRQGDHFSYVSFQQTHDQKDVWGATAVVRINHQGDWKTVSSTFVDPKLLSSVHFDDAKNVSLNTYFPRPYQLLKTMSVVYPRKEADDQMKFYPSRLFVVFALDNLTENWIWIDENSGKALAAYNSAEDLNDVKVTGTVLPFHEGDKPVAGWFPFVSAQVDGKTVASADALGVLKTAGITGAFQVILENQYLSVVNNDKSDTSLPVDLTQVKDGTINLDHGPSLEERMIYHYVMTARKFLHEKLHFDELTYQLVAIANYGDHFDNAFFMPMMKTLNFGAGGSLFYNTAHSRDIILHEFGHAATHQIYGLVSNYEFNAMNEAFSDYFAATITNEPRIGEGMLLPKVGREYLRNVDNHFVYPKDFSGTRFHDDGQMFSGALWDIRKALGEELADKMIHEARLAQAKTVGEFLTELLAIDEDSDDHNPLTKSKHFDVIWKAFTGHGLHADTQWEQQTEDLTIPWKRAGAGCLSIN